MYLSELQLITTAIRVCLFDIDKWSFLNLRRKFTKLVVKMYTAWSVSLATLLAFQLYHPLQQFILSLWVWLIYGVMLSISCFHTPQLTYNKGRVWILPFITKHFLNIYGISWLGDYGDYHNIVLFQITKFLNRSSLSE